MNRYLIQRYMQFGVVHAFLTVGFIIGISQASFAQEWVYGKVFSSSGEVLAGVNIYIEGTYDGATSDESGCFRFLTSEIGHKKLSASMIGFVRSTETIEIPTKDSISFILKESVNTIDAVTITAGVFAAADEKRASVLEPLDIYTTASANGDVMAAMRTMPGTQTAPDDGRLMVRGGDAYESKTFIDGLLAAKPYNSKTPDVATRGRFSPSLFNGVQFNSGGYSAEYGQALSSVLILNSTDVATNDNTGVSIMTIGGEASYTKAMKNSSLMLSGNYNNLYVSNIMMHPTIDWYKPVESFNVSGVYRYKPSSDALLKVYSAYDWGTLGYEVPGEKNFRVENKGKTSYTNIVYQDCISEKSCIKAGASFTYDKQELLPGEFKLNTQECNADAKVSLIHSVRDGLILSWGISDTYMNYRQRIKPESHMVEIELQTNDHLLAGYIESEIHLSKKLAFRPGIRLEYSSVLKKYNLAPRVAMAYKTGKNSQLSAAWGHYYQSPETNYLKLTDKLHFEHAVHYIASYQAGSLKNRLLRVEVYHKKYDNLVLYDGLSIYTPENIRNGGDGYANGMDVFLRDRKSVKNLDYWVTYSFIDTKRKCQNYPEKAVPSFIAKHTFSLVGKYWVHAISTQFGASYSLASGRNYNDPNTPHFMAKHTKPYSDLSLNFSHVFFIGNQYSVLYCSLSNVLGSENIVGYRAAFQPDSNGNYAMYPQQNDTRRFLFIGLFLNF